MVEQPVPEGLNPVEGTRWKSSGRTAARGKESLWRSSWGIVSHGRISPLEQGKSMRSPSPEEEGAEAKVCDELIITLVPHPPAPLRKQRNWGQS